MFFLPFLLKLLVFSVTLNMKSTHTIRKKLLNLIIDASFPWKLFHSFPEQRFNAVQWYMFSDYHKRHICTGTKLFSWFTSGSFRTTWLRVKKNNRMTSVSITLLHVFYRRHFQSELDFKQEVYILTNQKFIWIQVSLFFLTSSYNIFECYNPLHSLHHCCRYCLWLCQLKSVF